MSPRPCAVDPSGHARRVLEFDKVLSVVAQEARTPGGRVAVLELLPEHDLERIVSEQATVAEVTRALAAQWAPWPLEVADDAGLLLNAATLPGSRLDPAELLRLATSFEVAGRLRRALDAHPEEWRRVLQRAAGLVAHDGLVAAIRAVVDERGELREDASPALRGIRRELVAQRETLLARLESLLRTVGSADAYVTLRADRFVIPVRADHATSVRGIVHDRSASGATLFVEPLEVLDANNEMQRLRDAEHREVQRILEMLTRLVAADVDVARQSLEAIERVDALQARALWARTWTAAAPQIGSKVCLLGARHPLLEMQQRDRGAHAVPLDLDLGAAHALVLTGPNAGGKTVALKTVGLLALLHQAGVPIAARAESQLPVFARVVADIGDEQSIESAESTFSSHLRHVIEAVQAAGPQSLVLVDEFMAGTDPQEGAALAIVVLRRLVELGTTVLVTTHLEALKLFAHTTHGVANAGMSYDPTSRTPLYRLQPGVPGSSNALATAERLGLDAELLEAARAERGPGAGRLEAVIAALEAERVQLETTRRAADAAQAEAQRIREEHAQQLAELTATRRTALSGARREADALLSAAKSRIENTVRELRTAQASAESIRAAHGAVDAIETSLQEIRTESPGAGPNDPSAGVPQPGERVWVRPLGREGILERVESSGRASVRFGNVTLVVTATDLQRVGPGPVEVQPPPGRPGGGYTAPDLPPVSSRLDLRGLERAAALDALETFLDRMLLQGTHQGEIVHGKGTGVLRQAVQDYLTRRSDVEAHRLGEQHEGGTGVTIVTLR